VEGGGKLLSSFIGEGLWNEARVFTSPKSLVQIAGKNVSARPDEPRQNDSVGLAFGRGVEAPQISGKVIGGKKIGKDLFLWLSNIS
jgi:hypothetical protein